MIISQLACKVFTLQSSLDLNQNLIDDMISTLSDISSQSHNNNNFCFWNRCWKPFYCEYSDISTNVLLFTIINLNVLEAVIFWKYEPSEIRWELLSDKIETIQQAWHDDKSKQDKVISMRTTNMAWEVMKRWNCVCLDANMLCILVPPKWLITAASNLILSTGCNYILCQINSSIYPGNRAMQQLSGPHIWCNLVCCYEQHSDYPYIAKSYWMILDTFRDNIDNIQILQSYDIHFRHFTEHHNDSCEMILHFRLCEVYNFVRCTIHSYRGYGTVHCITCYLSWEVRFDLGQCHTCHGRFDISSPKWSSYFITYCCSTPLTAQYHSVHIS